MNDLVELADDGRRRRRRGEGPLAPWRLSLSVAASIVFTGMPLVDAATTGIDVDTALLRSFGVAFLTWVALGALNRALIDLPPADQSAEAEGDSAKEVHQ